MRLTREKIVRLSHKIMDVLVASDDVEFIEDRDTIRQQIVTLLTNSPSLIFLTISAAMYETRSRLISIPLRSAQKNQAKRCERKV